MKIFVFLILFSISASAGSSYKYTGIATIKSTHPKDSFSLRVEKLLAVEGSARIDTPGLEIKPGDEYVVDFKQQKNLHTKTSDKVYFTCAWSCGKNGCTEKKWVLISERQAKENSAEQ